MSRHSVSALRPRAGLASSGPASIGPAWIGLAWLSLVLVMSALLASLAGGCGRMAVVWHPEGEVEMETETAGLGETASGGPFAVVLGVAQDGGVPHAACDCRRCRHAHAHPAERPLVASLGIVLPQSGRTYLIDATPDVTWQLRALADAVRPQNAAETADDPRREGGVDRAPVDGVFLTHAHVGHYLGLAHFGREAVATRSLPVWGTPRMAAYLRRNGPWSQLVDLGNVELRELTPGVGAPGPAVELGEGVSVAALAVPHRDELSDTVGYLVRGPRSAVLYVPDTDGWEDWPVPPETVIAEAGVDLALLDGTFTSGDELPGRDLSEVRHPFILDSVERFSQTLGAGTEIRFLHFNHSNPALDPFEPLETSGWPPGLGLARQGEEWPL